MGDGPGRLHLACQRHRHGGKYQHDADHRKDVAEADHQGV
jgi:hypothetical protein